MFSKSLDSEGEQHLSGLIPQLKVEEKGAETLSRELFLDYPSIPFAFVAQLGPRAMYLSDPVA